MYEMTSGQLFSVITKAVELALEYDNPTSRESIARATNVALDLYDTESKKNLGKSSSGVTDKPLTVGRDKCSECDSFVYFIFEWGNEEDYSEQASSAFDIHQLVHHDS